MQNHGADPDHRFRIMRERIMAMKEIWTNDEAEYHGKHVDFDPVWSWPKPAQKPHPPVYVGGNGPHTLKRVVDYGDAWLPIPTRSEIPLSDRVRQLNQLTEEAGRGRIPVTVYGTLPREEVIGHYADLGIDRCIFWLAPAAESEAIAQLDRYAEMMGSFAKAGAS
jgi:alkanesulfonate monooxygenase SsuD/methylene tetrahydromethanopterin reductase-like flavin-dependent oxidoreductase (luciferase family)